MWWTLPFCLPTNFSQHLHDVTSWKSKLIHPNHTSSQWLSSGMVWTTEPLLLTCMLYCGSVLSTAEGCYSLDFLRTQSVGDSSQCTTDCCPTSTIHFRGVVRCPSAAFHCCGFVLVPWWPKAFFWGAVSTLFQGSRNHSARQCFGETLKCIFSKSCLFKTLIKKVTLLFSLWSPYFKLFFFNFKNSFGWTPKAKQHSDSVLHCLISLEFPKIYEVVINLVCRYL